MNNDEIINNIAASIYGKEEVDEMIARGIDVPVHTATGWKMRGPYKVKDDAIPLIVKLWKKRTNTSLSHTNRTDDKKHQFYLSKAFLYCKEQVELIEQ